MKHHLELNFPFQIIKDDIVYPEYQNIWQFAVVDATNYLTPVALNFFKQLGIDDLYCEFIKGDPNQKCNIHVDGRIMDDGSVYVRSEWAINIIWGSESSKMFWYRPHGKDLRRMMGDTGITYPIYYPEEVDVIEEYTVTGKPLLCDISTPHNVINFDDKIRWCMSIRSKSTKLQWADACKFFEQYSAEQQITA